MTMASPTPSPGLLGANDSLWSKQSVRRWTAKLHFTSASVMEAMMGCPLTPHLDPVDICAYLGGSKSMYPMVTQLYLDPLVYNKPPTSFESIQDNAHFKLLKIALLTAASVGGTPLIRNGGGRYAREFHCKLRNHVFCPRAGKKTDAPREDDCINQDKGGRRKDGRFKSKRTRTTQALKPMNFAFFPFESSGTFKGSIFIWNTIPAVPIT